MDVHLDRCQWPISLPAVLLPIQAVGLPVAASTVFVTLRLDGANVRRAAKMQDTIRESITKNPTLKP